jgi:hypothetical protein
MISAWFIWMTLFPALLITYEPENIQDENPGIWMSIKSSKDVSTYFRWVTSETGSTYRERKGIIYSECSMDEAVHYVTNADLAKKWMNNLDENYNLKTINRSEWYTYTLFDIPWPLNKRDMVSQYKVYSDSITKVTTIIITSSDKYISLKPGISRIHNYVAIWSITEYGKQVRITFQISANNPPEFPRYIQDPLIDRVFHNNLVRLKDLLATRK